MRLETKIVSVASSAETKPCDSGNDAQSGQTPFAVVVTIDGGDEVDVEVVVGVEGVLGCADNDVGDVGDMAGEHGNGACGVTIGIGCFDEVKRSGVFVVELVEVVAGVGDVKVEGPTVHDAAIAS